MNPIIRSILARFNIARTQQNEPTQRRKPYNPIFSPFLLYFKIGVQTTILLEPVPHNPSIELIALKFGFISLICINIALHICLFF